MRKSGFTDCVLGLSGGIDSSLAAYIAAQIIGGAIGVWLAHLMFELPVWQFSVTTRTGAGQWLARPPQGSSQ